MKKILLLDLDGTIREPITGKFIDTPNNQRIIPGADKAIEHFHKRGWDVVGISNQGGIQYGYKSLESCIEEMKETLRLFPRLDSIYFCPDMAGNDCIYVDRIFTNYFSFEVKENYIYCPERQTGASFRKPGEDMLTLALFRNLGIPWKYYVHRQVYYDDYECWMIGDRPEDEEAAKNFGINFLAADVWRNRFLPGVHEYAVTPTQLEFLEGIQLSR